MTLIGNRAGALVVRTVGFVLGVFGIAVMLTVSDAGTMLSYYTMQTNIFTVGAFGILAVMTAVQIKRGGVRGEVATFGASAHLALTFYITITFVVYWAMLSWQNFDMGGGDSARVALTNAANYTVHGVVPVLAVLDWILLCRTEGCAQCTLPNGLSIPRSMPFSFYPRGSGSAVLRDDAVSVSFY